MIRKLLCVAATAWFAATGSSAQAQAEPPLKVGFMTIKTGPLAGPGKFMEDGIRLLLKERNNTLSGRKIELIVADTAGQPATARTKAQELVERNKVDVLIGPLATTEMLAVDDYIREAKIPIVASSALAEDLTQRNPNPWFLRAVGTTGQLMHPLADYTANTLKYKRVATIATDFAYGHEAIGAFQRVFEESGGRVVQKIWVPPTASDFAGYISQIRRDVDAVVASFSGASATGFVRQYREYGLKDKLPLIVSHTTTDESLLKDQGDGALGITSSAMYSAALDLPANKTFVAAYRKEYGTDPGFYSMGSYIAGLFLEEALKTTGGRADRATLIKALRSARLASSPRGPLRVDEYGNPVGDIYIRKVERSREGQLQNSVIKVYANQTQFWTYDTKQFLANPVYSRDWPPSKFLEK